MRVAQITIGGLRRIKGFGARAAQDVKMPNRPLILLLVADEPLREALRFSLETEGYKVATRPDGRPVAAVVIDDSGEAWPMVEGPPTIVLTGDAERLMRRGASGVSVVEKPLLDDTLERKLSALLGKIQPGETYPGRAGRREG